MVFDEPCLFLTMTISLEWSGTGKAHQIDMSIRMLSNVYFLFIFYNI